MRSSDRWINSNEACSGERSSGASSDRRGSRRIFVFSTTRGRKDERKGGEDLRGGSLSGSSGEARREVAPPASQPLRRGDPLTLTRQRRTLLRRTGNCKA